MSRLTKVSAALLPLVLPATRALAQQTVQIGNVSGGNAGTGVLTKFLQTWAAFATGPWAVAVIAISIVIGITIWMFAPREGPMAWVARGVIGGIVLMNLVPYLTDMGFKSGS